MEEEKATENEEEEACGCEQRSESLVPRQRTTPHATRTHLVELPMVPRIAAEAGFVNHLVRLVDGQREVRQETLLRDARRDAHDVHGAELSVFEVAHFVDERRRSGAPLRIPLRVHLARCHELEKVALDFLRRGRSAKRRHVTTEERGGSHRRATDGLHAAASGGRGEEGERRTSRKATRWSGYTTGRMHCAAPAAPV